MTKPTLTYFDGSFSRGEECRLALSCAGVDFNDNRIKRDQWMALKPTTQYGSLPLFEIPGKGVLAQSNAILTYIGREYGLLPADNFEAARHLAFMSHVEALRESLGSQLRISEEAQKKAARAEIATKTLPAWAAAVEKQLGDGPFVGGAKISVADIKLYMAVRWFASGTVDLVPTDVFAPYPKLTRLYHAVGDHPGVKSWQAKFA
jgi:prostaglandin-H2 D-isomerase / glutathione transferase